MRFVLLTLLLATSAARADVCVPPAPPQEPACSNEKWLAIKHALRTYCKAHRRDDPMCEMVLDDLKTRWCDGEGDQKGCKDSSALRHSPDRCRLLGPGADTGTLLFGIYPDCYCWKVTVRPKKSGPQIVALDSGDCVCD